MPVWLKPSYIVILVLLALLGVQTVRLSGAKLDLAHAQTAQAQLTADIATKRAEGVAEGKRLQDAARAKLDAEHESIVSDLQQDKVKLQQHYDATYALLKDLAGQDKWGCLAQPLPEETLKEFRR